jgi:hypothetical protein
MEQFICQLGAVNTIVARIWKWEAEPKKAAQMLKKGLTFEELDDDDDDDNYNDDGD